MEEGQDGKFTNLMAGGRDRRPIVAGYPVERPGATKPAAMEFTKPGLKMTGLTRE